ncbi:MAG TPA: branched-chain amino acid ABC transporter permease [Hyphomicrobiaceae bacterium]|nr:branched-chain amino acid ABC transporter permease [Hyphomicrobiaceae bacterium]
MNHTPAMLPRTRTGWLLIATGFAALALAPFAVSSYHVELLTTALIAAMLALSLQLLVGVTGLVSLGHGAFYGLAAYVVYFLSPEGAAKPMWMTLPIAMAAAALAAFIVGLFALRTKGFFFLMVTLAFGQMIFFVFHDTGIGGGTDGAYLAKPTVSALGYTLELPRRQRPIGTFYVALIQLILMYAALAALLSTLYGRTLEGIRINESRMRAIGFDTQRAKLIAFTLAGALAGAAGHMWAMHRGVVNPEIVGWHKSAEALLMILLGGLGTLHGPIIGAIAYLGLTEVAQLVTERKLLVEGLVILAAVLILPKGLSGLGYRRKSKAGTKTGGRE